GERRLRLLLSFAIGGLVGDVFLHLLPEAMRHAHSEAEQIRVGLWVIAGVFFFVLLEMVFNQSLQEEPTPEPREQAAAAPQPAAGGADLRRRHLAAGDHSATNGSAKGVPPPPPPVDRPPVRQVAGYLNLLANSVDNFTHGLAIGGSFLASTRIGLLTTFAILIHEIPHEVGFGRWEAAKAQMATATLGITGAISALLADDPKALADHG
ncbi:zinc transporter ZIP13-like, partial [Pollicipes pollicipes]|uniref:zinc transporter ZIP13-like n=1 Tax=Pollicipes pollicipes TaxID=41117 RepID=UPI001884CCE1